MIQAIFTDIDGTLLRSDHTISNKNKEAIKKAIKKYIPVFIATGRSARDAKSYYKTLFLDTPAICMNGTYIIDLKNDQILKEERISLPLVIDLRQALEFLPLSAIYYSQDRWITQKITLAIEKEISTIGFLIEVMPFESILKNWSNSQNGPNKIGLLSNDEKQLLESYDWLRKIFKGRLNIQRSQLNFIEVIPLGVSKKTGIEYILKKYPDKYPFSKENIMAIGDSDNDIEMLRWAGISVAMGNAAEHIKKVAEITTLSNQEDGLAYIINQHLNNIA